MKTDKELATYIEEEIIPRYARFDMAHREDHARMVIEQSLEIGAHYDVNINMVYTIAAMHDLGLAAGRETHHLESGRIIREDMMLRRWFTEEEIETMAEAAEDHRASSRHEPRSIYGKIVAEADRFIKPEKIVERTIQFGFDHYAQLDREGHWQRTLEHLRAKYGDGGYLKLWFPESPNVARLESLRRIIRDEARLRKIFDATFERLSKQLIRIETCTEADYRITEAVTREAFWNVYGPGCSEHFVLRTLREKKAVVPQLDVLARLGDKIVGCAACTVSGIDCADGRREVLTLGPIGVLPEYQRRGIGAVLIDYVRTKAAELGYAAIVLTGDPEYYGKRGFMPAMFYGVQNADGKYFTPLQISLLDKRTHLAGRYHDNEAYFVTPAEVEAYDQTFPCKEKVSGTPSQLRFQELIASAGAEA